MHCLLASIDGRLGSAVAPKPGTGNHPAATRGSRMTTMPRGGVKYLLAFNAIHHNLWIAVPGRQFDRSVDNLLGLTEGDIALVDATGAGDRVHSVSNWPDPETAWKKDVEQEPRQVEKKVPDGRQVPERAAGRDISDKLCHSPSRPALPEDGVHAAGRAAMAR